MTSPNEPHTNPNAVPSPGSQEGAAHPYETQPRVERERPRSTAAQWVTVGLLAAIGFGFLGWLLLSSNDNESAAPQAAQSTHASETVATSEHDTAEDGVVGLPGTEDSTPEAEAASDVPAESQDALQAAQEYLAAQPISQSNLYNQLRDEEDFSAEAASYAVETVEADWNALALQVAQQLQADGTPEDELLKALTEGPEHFTRAQAEHALGQLQG